MVPRLALLTILVLVATTGGLRSCVDVQNTLMACIYSSSGPDVVNNNDIEYLCRHIWAQLECVEDANSTCPNLPILSDPDFQQAVGFMKSQSDNHCNASSPDSTTMAESSTTMTTNQQTTSSSMFGDEADSDSFEFSEEDSSESCDPLAAMMRCNEIMRDVTPGDIEAMCGPGEEFLDCMTDIVLTCPQHADLPFDLEHAINATRDTLRMECSGSLEEEACAEKIDEAKQGCASYLTDGQGDYCGSLRMYIGCLNVTLADCPDPEQSSVLAKQYRHHCVEDNHGGGIPKCPDDAQAAVMECNNHVMNVNPNDKPLFCRKSEKYLACMTSLMDRCQNDSRFAALSPGSLEPVRQQMASVCQPHKDPIPPQPMV